MSLLHNHLKLCHNDDGGDIGNGEVMLKGLHTRQVCNLMILKTEQHVLKVKLWSMIGFWKTESQVFSANTLGAYRFLWQRIQNKETIQKISTKQQNIDRGNI